MDRIKRYIAVLRKAEERTWVRWLVGIWTFASIYDLLLSQFMPEEYSRHLPKLWSVAAMTGNILPIWAWLLMLLIIIIVALLEQIINAPKSNIGNPTPELKLIESFPVDGQGITFDDLKRMYLRFNNPINQDTEGTVQNYYVREPSICQWNICGWVEYAEEGKKLIWHPHEHYLESNKNRNFKVDGIAYHNFEIRIGAGKKNSPGSELMDIYGNKLPKTYIRVFMK